MIGRMGCILTYGGTGVDIAINYFLLVLNLLCCTAIMVEMSEELRKYAIGAFAFVVAFQISLCLVLGCSGISIIWCAMAGWVMTQRRFETEATPNRTPDDSVPASSSIATRSDSQLSWILRSVVFIDFCAIVYYGVIAAPITTVAHFCALALGSLLWILAMRLIPVPEGGDHQPLMTT